MFDIFVIIIVGGLIGWIASLIMNTDKQQGSLLNIIVGVAGALLARLVTSQTILSGEFGIKSLAGSVAGALVLLAVANLVRKGRLR